MYEAGYRIRIEVTGAGIEATSNYSDDVMIKQCCKESDFYVMALLCLKICSRDNQWLVRPFSIERSECVTRNYSQSNEMLQETLKWLHVMTFIKSIG